MYVSFYLQGKRLFLGLELVTSRAEAMTLLLWQDLHTTIEALQRKRKKETWQKFHARTLFPIVYYTPRTTVLTSRMCDPPFNRPFHGRILLNCFAMSIRKVEILINKFTHFSEHMLSI